MWLVTTQSWKCSVTAAYSSGAPVIAIFECQIRGNLDLLSWTWTKALKKPAQNCKIPTWLENSLPKMSLQCGHPTHPNLTTTCITAGWRGGHLRLVHRDTQKASQVRSYRRLCFACPRCMQLSSTSIHSVHQGLCVYNVIVTSYIYICTVYKKAGTATVYHIIMYCIVRMYIITLNT